MPTTRIAVLLLAAAVLGGCGTTAPRGEWGAQATLTPGWDRIQNAAYRAATDPVVWAPLAGAAVLWATGWDEEVSDWAVEETPLFGSIDAASDVSDQLYDLSWGILLASTLATPSGEGGDWLANKAAGIAVDLAAVGLTGGATASIKGLTQRHRPDPDASSHSFPSGHASHAAVCVSLAMRNLESVAMPEWERATLNAGLYGVAALTAWTRVEAQRHYPSDVLAGFALGHFMANFVTDAFLVPHNPNGLSLGLVALPEGAELVMQLPFR